MELDDRSDITLNENHRRALKSAFLQVERSLKSFTTQLADMKRQNNGANSMQVSRAQQKIAATERLLKELKIQFKINAERHVNPFWSIRVGVTLLWEILEDCKSKQLKGYGELTRESQVVLDGYLEQLIQSLNEIAQAVE